VIRVFLDSSALIAACGSASGASHAVIVMAEIGLFKVVISEQVVDECERNLMKKLPKALPVFRQIISTIAPEILPNPSTTEIEQWVAIIEPKDAPILPAAVVGQVNRLLTLNTKDFTPEVSAQSGLLIQTPSEFIQQIRALINKELSE